MFLGMSEFKGPKQKSEKGWMQGLTNPSTCGVFLVGFGFGFFSFFPPSLPVPLSRLQPCVVSGRYWGYCQVLRLCMGHLVGQIWEVLRVAFCSGTSLAFGHCL